MLLAFVRSGSFAQCHSDIFYLHKPVSPVFEGGSAAILFFGRCKSIFTNIKYNDANEGFFNRYLPIANFDK